MAFGIICLGYLVEMDEKQRADKHLVLFFVQKHVVSFHSRALISVERSSLWRKLIEMSNSLEWSVFTWTLDPS